MADGTERRKLFVGGALDRIDTNRPKAMADALFKPSAVLLAGVGASAAILAGLGPLAIPIGLAAWAARVAVALPKKRRRPRVDVRSLSPSWRGFVHDAMQAEDRFQRALRTTQPGPLRDRLAEVGQRIGDGVQEIWHVAQRGDQLEAAVRDLDVDGVARELDQAEAAVRQSPGHADLEATCRSLQEQLAAARRLRSLTDTTRERLTRLNAQLDEAVARAVELSLNVTDASRVAPLGTDVEGVVGELEALRQGLDEAGGAAGATATG